MVQHKVRVGVIGANGRQDRWGVRAHIPAVQSLPEVELRAVCTAHPETAEAAARQTGAPFAFHDYRELLRSPEVDLVTVAVRISLHYPIVMAALEAGKHVFCEWPLGLSSSQGEEMQKMAQRQGRRHAVGAQGVFAPAVMRMRELVQEGFLGEPFFFHVVHFLPNYIAARPSHRWWLTRKEEGGGAHAIACGHAIAVLRYCLGEVAEVCGETAIMNKRHRFADTGEEVQVETDDTVAYLARLRNGMSGTVHVSSVCWGSGYWRFEVFGSQGKLRAEAPGMLQYTPSRLYGARPGEPDRELPIPERLRWVRLPEESEGHNVAQLLHSFIQSIAQGKGFHPDFEDAVRLHRIQEAVERSSREGRWVPVA